MIARIKEAVLPTKGGPWRWLADRPRLILRIGVSSAILFLLLSLYTHKWHWFPRGGAILALSGFLVSVRESLLFRPKRERQTRLINPYAPLTGYLGTPIFPPALSGDLTDEEIDQRIKQHEMEVADAIEENSEVVDPGDEGRPMRETSEMTEMDFRLLRISSILGVIGTLIWAFGDLFGGLPKS
jgi:hypothetical protein